MMKKGVCDAKLGILLFVAVTWVGILSGQTAPTATQRLAEEAFDAGDMATAHEQYAKLLSLDAANPVWHARFGAACTFDPASFDLAFTHLKRAAQLGIEKTELHSEWLFFSGKAAHLGYDFPQAVAHFSAYLESGKKRDPLRPEAEQRLAQCQAHLEGLRGMQQVEVLEKFEANRQLYFRFYALQPSAGRLVAVPPELRSKLDDKRGHSGQMQILPNLPFVLFSSYGEDGEQGLDIYRAEVEYGGGFSEPIRLPSPINTPFDETTPTYIPPSNGKQGSLHFASNRPEALGGFDLFDCTFDLAADPTSWAFSAINQKDYTINTTSNEWFYMPAGDGQRVWFASDREGDFQALQVYQIREHTTSLAPTTLRFDIPSTLAEAALATGAKLQLFNLTDNAPVLSSTLSSGTNQLEATMLQPVGESKTFEWRWVDGSGHSIESLDAFAPFNIEGQPSGQTITLTPLDDDFLAINAEENKDVSAWSPELLRNQSLIEVTDGLALLDDSDEEKGNEGERGNEGNQLESKGTIVGQQVDGEPVNEEMVAGNVDRQDGSEFEEGPVAEGRGDEEERMNAQRDFDELSSIEDNLQVEKSTTDQGGQETEEKTGEGSGKKDIGGEGGTDALEVVDAGSAGWIASSELEVIGVRGELGNEGELGNQRAGVELLVDGELGNEETVAEIVEGRDGSEFEEGPVADGRGDVGEGVDSLGDLGELPRTDDKLLGEEIPMDKGNLEFGEEGPSEGIIGSDNVTDALGIAGTWTEGLRVSNELEMIEVSENPGNEGEIGNERTGVVLLVNGELGNEETVAEIVEGRDGSEFEEGSVADGRGDVGEGVDSLGDLGELPRTDDKLLGEENPVNQKNPETGEEGRGRREGGSGDVTDARGAAGTWTEGLSVSNELEMIEVSENLRNEGEIGNERASMVLLVDGEPVNEETIAEIVDGQDGSEFEEGPVAEGRGDMGELPSTDDSLQGEENPVDQEIPETGEEGRGRREGGSDDVTAARGAAGTGTEGLVVSNELEMIEVSENSGKEGEIGNERASMVLLVDGELGNEETVAEIVDGRDEREFEESPDAEGREDAEVGMKAMGDLGELPKTNDNLQDEENPMGKGNIETGEEGPGEGVTGSNNLTDALGIAGTGTVGLVVSNELEMIEVSENPGNEGEIGNERAGVVQLADGELGNEETVAEIVEARDGSEFREGHVAEGRVDVEEGGDSLGDLPSTEDDLQAEENPMDQENPETGEEGRGRREGGSSDVTGAQGAAGTGTVGLRGSNELEIMRVSENLGNEGTSEGRKVDGKPANNETVAEIVEGRDGSDFGASIVAEVRGNVEEGAGSLGYLGRLPSTENKLQGEENPMHQENPETGEDGRGGREAGSDDVTDARGTAGTGTVGLRGSNELEVKQGSEILGIEDELGIEGNQLGSRGTSVVQPVDGKTEIEEMVAEVVDGRDGSDFGASVAAGVRRTVEVGVDSLGDLPSTKGNLQGEEKPIDQGNSETGEKRRKGRGKKDAAGDAVTDALGVVAQVGEESNVSNQLGLLGESMELGNEDNLLESRTTSAGLQDGEKSVNEKMKLEIVDGGDERDFGGESVAELRENAKDAVNALEEGDELPSTEVHLQDHEIPNDLGSQESGGKRRNRRDKREAGGEAWAEALGEGGTETESLNVSKPQASQGEQGSSGSQLGTKVAITRPKIDGQPTSAASEEGRNADPLRGLSEAARAFLASTFVLDAATVEAGDPIAEVASKDVFPAGQTVYSVQVGAFRNRPEARYFGSFSPVIAVPLPSGVARYLTGIFPDYEEAARARDAIRSIGGFEDAFVVVYADGERIPLVGRETEAPAVATMLPAEEGIGGRDWAEVSGVWFSIQIGAFQGFPTSDLVEALCPCNREMLDGRLTRWTAGKYEDLEVALTDLEGIRATLVPDAFVVAFSEGRRVKIADAVQARTATSLGEANVMTYRVKVVRFGEKAPASEAAKLLRLSEFVPMQAVSVGAWTTYYSLPYAERGVAELAVERCRQAGFDAVLEEMRRE